MATEGKAVLGAKVRVPRIKGLTRERLDDLLRSAWTHRLGLVVAPAGSGKTTLLAQFAAASGVPVAWYRAEPADASAAAAVAHLERGFVGALGLEGGWTSIDDGIEALDAWKGDRALLAVDDLHALWGTEAEATIERLLAHLPPGIVMVAATRRAPGFNLSRLRVSGELFEIGAEELRFRSWEVERLFIDFYGEPLPPDELAELERRTEGWAAGLQLFHLATRGKPAGERRRVLHELGMRSRLVREYLARNVLDELPVHVRDFLLQTCVLGRLTSALCDEIRSGTSSDTLLAELEHRQIFTTPLDEEGSYRYHEVLRSYLEAALVEAVGETEARRRYRRAGSLLEAHGHLPEALRAYCRAEDWSAARILLGDRGEQLIDRPGAWLASLPPTMLDQDPWLLLASARRGLAEGRWELALDTYARAEAASGPGEPGQTSRRERVALEGWFAPAVSAPADWSGILRLALTGDPAGVAVREQARLTGATGALVQGLCLLLAGRVGEAADELDRVALLDDASAAASIGSALAASFARALLGDDVGDEVVRLSESAEEIGLGWLVGVSRLVSSVQRGDDVDAMSSSLAKDGSWGLPLAQLSTGLGHLAAGAGATELLADAAEGFASVGAPVLEAWAIAAQAVAASAGGARRRGLDEARRALRQVGAGDLIGVFASLAAVEPVASTPVPASTIHVRCFGPLEVEIDGVALDLSAIKPRVRSLLRVLALHAGRPVHRDRLVDWLWPGEGDLRVGMRNLQVAVSALRQWLEPGVARGAAAIVVREADTYRLQLDQAAIDLLEFDDLVAVGRHARAAGDADAAIAALDAALDLYRGELLADEGSAEWLFGERDRLQVAAGDASQLRAELLFAEGRVPDAIAEAERGLRLDRYRDALWRLLIAAGEQAGDRAMVARNQERYATVLRELGV